MANNNGRQGGGGNNQMNEHVEFTVKVSDCVTMGKLNMHVVLIFNLTNLAFSFIMLVGRRGLVLDRFGEYDSSRDSRNKLFLSHAQDAAIFVSLSSLRQVPWPTKGRLGVLFRQSSRERGHSRIRPVAAT